MRAVAPLTSRNPTARGNCPPKSGVFAATGVPDAHSSRILIVDDNEANRQILVTRLSKHGYEILQAADGEEALASALQHRPDLILLDVDMPKLDGFEVCRRLKKDPRL
jgi:CheY-like chemotaxis protein